MGNETKLKMLAENMRKAWDSQDMNAVAQLYAEDAIMVTLDGSYKGREAIMSDFFQAWLGQFPDTKINFEKVAIEEDVCLLYWTAEASKMTIPAGIGVLMVRDGLIKRQAEWFQMIPKEG